MRTKFRMSSVYRIVETSALETEIEFPTEVRSD